MKKDYFISSAIIFLLSILLTGISHAEKNTFVNFEKRNFQKVA